MAYKLRHPKYNARNGHVVYTEIEPLLKTENPPKIGVGYVVFDKATDKKVSATGVILLDEFTTKGNSVVPFTLKLRVQDSGAYRLVLLGVDSANYQAPQKKSSSPSQTDE